MDFLVALWVPILASAAAVWVTSAIIWMVLPHHAKDFKKLPDEDAFIAFIKNAGLPPGVYGYPEFGSHSDAKKEDVKKKWDEGCMGMLYVWAKPNMGRNMVLSFLVYLVIGLLIAYLSWNAFSGNPGGAKDASFGSVMQVSGTAGVLAYCTALIPNGIWFQTPGRTLLMNLIDGVAYGLITGLIFAALWA